MSFRISRSSGIEPARRRSLSQSRVEGSANAGGNDYYSSRRTPYNSTGSSYSNGYNPSGLSSYSSGRRSYNPTSSYSSSSSSASPYISKYSNYDNGVTVAGLNLSLNGGNGVSSRTYSGGSNPSLNAGSSYQSAALSSSLYRSHSLREQERKSRSRNRRTAANPSNTSSTKMYSKRSQSASSEKSEGYESGAEESRKSRLSSVSTNQSEGGDYLSPSDAKSRDSNGEFIDYKALYEAQKAENDKLKEQMKNKDEALSNTKAALERFTNATTKNTLSDLEKRERRAMERKMSEMEEELKLLQKYKTENERLRAENRALTRVVSKLTTSAQNQLQNK